MPTRVDVNWDAQPLGILSDSQIARNLGLAKVTVWRERNMRGVPPAQRNRAPGIDWDRQPLGRVSDRQLSRMLGVTMQTVSRVRKKRQIPPFMCITAQNKHLVMTPKEAKIMRHVFRCVSRGAVPHGLPAMVGFKGLYRKVLKSNGTTDTHT
jgi:hypothetical protein